MDCFLGGYKLVDCLIFFFLFINNRKISQRKVRINEWKGFESWDLKSVEKLTNTKNKNTVFYIVYFDDDNNRAPS